MATDLTVNDGDIYARTWAGMNVLCIISIWYVFAVGWFDVVERPNSNELTDQSIGRCRCIVANKHNMYILCTGDVHGASSACRSHRIGIVDGE